MENLTADGDSITVKLRVPIRDESGFGNRLIFRAVQAADTSVVTAWYIRAGSQPFRRARVPREHPQPITSLMPSSTITSEGPAKGG